MKDDLLPISGIQHFVFCRRRWCLIHIEGQWVENHLTADGRENHRRSDDPDESETRGDLIFLRALPLASPNLGIYGRADVVELHRSPDRSFSTIFYRGDHWIPIPVEHKRGGEYRECDAMQLCAQGMCIEDLHGIRIDEGFLFYKKTRRRVRVPFDDDLRGKVVRVISEMRELIELDKPVPPVEDEYCTNCSMSGVCVPRLHTFGRVSGYMKKMISTV